MKNGKRLETILIIFGLILIPFMSIIPRQIRLIVLNATQKMAETSQIDTIIRGAQR